VNPDVVPRHLVVTALRLNLPYFAVASIIAVAGIASLLLARLRSRDRLLLWVGIFSLLYAARLFVENDLVRTAFHVPETEYLPYSSLITYAINIPFALFALELFGRGWKNTIALWMWVCVVFAAIAMPTSLVHQMSWLHLINNIVVVGGTLLVLLHVWIGRRAGNPLVASLLWPLLVVGLFVLWENEGFRVYGLSVEPVGFLVLLAGLGSVAVRRALATERKLIDVEQELSTARRIQFSILPQAAPDFAGVRVAARYQPMTAVAGDFYDFLSPSNDLLTILVADVSGHGVPAALVSSMLKVCFAAQIQNTGSSPAAILSGVGRMLRGSLAGQYVTAACATIDRRSSTVTYAGAGHPPSVLVRGKDRDSVLLDENGLFMGPFPNATYAEISLPFRSGDRLLLYTDGITEAHDPAGEEFGRDRLLRFLADANDVEPTSTLDRLFERIATGNPQDDLTAVLVHFE
jgi:sigma-B regulation protein RsbU (phosphoserine phosphatase)